MTEKNPDNPFPESDDNPSFEDVSSLDENEVTVILPEELTEEVGHELTEDVNGRQQEGFGRFDRNVRKGNRWSASQAYLRPVRHRPNLDVICRAFATRILFEGRRAVGIEYERRGRTYRVGAGEVHVVLAEELPPPSELFQSQ